MDKRISEVAYSRSSFLRIVTFNNWFFVESKTIRGQGKLGAGVFWKRLMGSNNLNSAVQFMEAYAS